MKKKSASQSGSFNPRVLIGFVLCSIGVVLALAGLTKSVTGMSTPTGTANPVPLINQPLIPDAIAPGSAGFTLTVNGTGFVTESVVKWNDSVRPTTFVSNSQLTASIPESDIATAGTATVTVVSPRPGGGTSNSIFFSIIDPTSTIALRRSDYATGSGPRGVLAADFDRDGKVDVATANFNDDTVSILLGDGDGTFQPPVDYGTDSNPIVLAVGDFNRDGRVDLMTSNQAPGTVSILLGNGDGTFGTHTDFAAGPGPIGLSTGDFNGDGNLDAIVTNTFFFHTVSVMLGNGDGTLQPPVRYNTGNVPRAVTVGDFNGDNKLDLAVANEDCCSFLVTTVSILLGNGDGTFQPRVDYDVGSAPLGITAADFNADGRLDVVTANFIDSTVSILLGNGDGTFQAHVDYATAPGASNTAVGDFNGDGNLDLAVAEADGDGLGNTISTLLGNGDGTFQPHRDYRSGVGPSGPAIGDFNRDGRLDLASGSGSVVSIFLQTPVAARACLMPPGGLVSWWAGDKTAEDVQGINNGVLLNGASFRPGRVGPGFLFDGIDDAVKIPNSASLSQTRLTVDAWVYPTGNVGLNRHIISKDHQFVAREYILGIQDLDRFNAFVSTNNGDFNLFSSTAPILNAWTHLAMTHDGIKLRLYVNGVLDTSMDAVGDIVPTSNPVGIGANVTGTFFKGSIDEVQIFNRVLSDAEILAIYQAGADGQCKPEIFVSSITPSYEVFGQGFLISTTVVIQDENGIRIENASVEIKTILPSGSVLGFPVTTDSAGQATISFAAAETGLYKFRVRKVSHPIRVYDASLNIETSDTLLIP